MKIDKIVRKLWNKKNRRLEKFKMCKYCCDSGCDNPDYHELQLMQFAFDEGLKNKKKR